MEEGLTLPGHRDCGFWFLFVPCPGWHVLLAGRWSAEGMTGGDTARGGRTG